MKRMSVIVAIGLVILLCLACSTVTANESGVVSGSAGSDNITGVINAEVVSGPPGTPAIPAFLNDLDAGTRSELIDPYDPIRKELRVPVPVANFVGTPTTGTAPLTVTFTDSSTNTPTSWYWTFGDGRSSTEKNPSHIYTSAGSYTVSLIASNAGGSTTMTRTSYITVFAYAPEAYFTANPASGTAPLTVTFTDSSTNTPTSWNWNFGDGSSSTSQNPSHTYTSNGTYTVSLTATNSAGSNTITRTNYITVGSGAIDNTIIGFRWDTSDPSPRLYQIDSTGAIIANKDATFWDNWNVTGNMKTVVVNATSSTVAYGTNNRGDGLDLSGAYGDVMVEIPVFYTCSTYANGNFSYWISPLPAPGFTVAPMFNQRGTGTAAGTPAPCYYVGRYDANLSGTKLISATGKALPVNISISQARTYAENKGDGWGITNVWTLSGLRQLFYTEMLTLDSQAAWTGSRGIVDDTESTVGARPSGADGIDTHIYANNATGSGTGTNGFTPVSYRGIENLWGNVWQFQDGFNAVQGTTNVISPTGLGVTGQKTTFKDVLDANDVQSVGALPFYWGWQKSLMNTDVARPLFLPSAVGGSETTYLSDYYYFPWSTNPGAPDILISGGGWASAGCAGVGRLDADSDASTSGAPFGARVEFRRSTAPGAPIANFTGTPTSGTAPLTVIFTDISTNTPTSWNWSFGDGSLVNSTVQHPVHTYASASIYTVSLTATNAAGSDTKTVANYITVNASSGVYTVGVFRNGSFYLKDATAFGYGLTGDTPISGDWTGIGVDTVGVFRNGSFYLKDGPSFSYGLTGDKPVAGNWTGDSTTGVGVFRDGWFFLRDSTTGGTYACFAFGQVGDYPIAGDWDGNGATEVGIFRDGVFYLRDSTGGTYSAFAYGLTGDKPIAGDWDGNGATEVGVFRDGSFYLRAQDGTTYDQFGYGLTGDTPIAGKWT